MSEMKCPNCNDKKWVCEVHKDKDWENCCGGAGMPCPECNDPDEPEDPPGFRRLEIQ
jgi:hypothetical protein